MTRFLSRWTTVFAPVLLSTALVLTPAFSQQARAQAPADPNAAEPAAGAGEGRPLDGYLATIALVMLALFIVGRSARR
jgi:hypothetical protein